jgi:phosphate transport system substrate-binding protein
MAREDFAMRGLEVLACGAVLFVSSASAALEIRVGGSTTQLPVVSACAAHFMEKYPTWDKADGSLPKDRAIIYVTGGGSGFGVKGIESGTLDIGMVSRDLKPAEIEALGGTPIMKAIARDAIAIATNAQNPISKKEGFTSAELAAIFSGEKKTYADIDPKLPVQEIVLLVRDAAGGSTEIFQERVMKEKRMAPSRLQFPSTAALIKKLETNNSAIAFVSAGALSTEGGLRAYSVDGAAPTEANIVAGSYKLNRPMLLVAKADAKKPVLAFIDFALGACQSTVAEMGFVPVNAPKN